jgi:hypothetical protein
VVVTINEAFNIVDVRFDVKVVIHQLHSERHKVVYRGLPKNCRVKKRIGGTRVTRRIKKSLLTLVASLWLVAKLLNDEA